MEHWQLSFTLKFPIFLESVFFWWQNSPSSDPFDLTKTFINDAGHLSGHAQMIQ